MRGILFSAVFMLIAAWTVVAAGPAAAQNQNAGGLLITPKITVPQRLFGFDHSLVVQYYYKLEFYTLPGTIEIRETHKIMGRVRKLPPHVGAIGLFENNQEIPFANFKPQKVLTFKRPIDLLPNRNFNHFDHPFWVCTDMENGTDNPSGQYDDFCGAIDLNGNIVYKLPIKQHFPDHVLVLKRLSNDGKKAVLIEGRAIPFGGAGDQAWGMDPVRETITWDYPNGLRTVAGYDGHATGEK